MNNHTTDTCKYPQPNTRPGQVDWEGIYETLTNISAVLRDTAIERARYWVEHDKGRHLSSMRWILYNTIDAANELIDDFERLGMPREYVERLKKFPPLKLDLDMIKKHLPVRVQKILDEQIKRTN